MARNRNKKWRAFASLSLLFAVSVSTTAQDTGNASGKPTHAETSGYAGTMLEETAPAQTDRTPTAAMTPNRTRGVEAGKASKDLTGFFAIGFIINILVIGAFLYWAAGQWRRRR